jgi:hypothetical protein
MKNKQINTNTHYIYRADPKDTTCEKCIANDGKIFEEDYVPLLPIHPNCRCQAKRIDTVQFLKVLLVNIKKGEYYINDDFLPKERGRYWMKITVSPEQKIYYSNDGLVFISRNYGKTIRQAEYNEEIFDILYSLPMVYTKKILEYKNKPVNEYDNIAMPERDDDKYLYFVMDDGTELRANMDTLNGMGILPNGEILVGYGKDDPQYYYRLLVLREKYTKAIENGESEKKLYDMRVKVWREMQKKYPNDIFGEIAKSYENNWLNIPDDYYQIVDVTGEIDDILNGYVESEKWQTIKENKNLFNDIVYFIEAYTENAMDLKNNPDWYHPLYIYNGEILDVDAFGNIILGFVGAYIGFREIDLHFAADVVQKLESAKAKFPNILKIIESLYKTIDDERDYSRIAQGYALYKNSYGG